MEKSVKRSIFVGHLFGESGPPDHPMRELNEYTISFGGEAFIRLTRNQQGGAQLESVGLKCEEDGDEDTITYNTAIDGLEHLVLAQWVAGIDVTTAEYRSALVSTLDALGNQFF